MGESTDDAISTPPQSRRPAWAYCVLLFGAGMALSPRYVQYDAPVDVSLTGAAILVVGLAILATGVE